MRVSESDIYSEAMKGKLNLNLSLFSPNFKVAESFYATISEAVA